MNELELKYSQDLGKNGEYLVQQERLPMDNHRNVTAYIGEDAASR